LDGKTLKDLLMDDTMLITAIYLIIESRQLGLNVHDALKKFRGSFSYFQLPLALPT